MRDAQLTAEEHRQPSRHCRAHDTGRDDAYRIFGGIGDGALGDEGQPEYPHRLAGFQLFRCPAILEQVGRQAHRQRRGHAGRHHRGHGAIDLAGQ